MANVVSIVRITMSIFIERNIVETKKAFVPITFLSHVNSAAPVNRFYGVRHAGEGCG